MDNTIGKLKYWRYLQGDFLYRVHISRLRKAVVILISVVVGALLLGKAAEQKVEIVRVVREIKAGHSITEEMVRMVAVGAYSLPDNVMREKEQVVGKYAMADLSIGDYVLNAKLTGVPAVDNSCLYRLDGTKQAISMHFSLVCRGDRDNADRFLSAQEEALAALYPPNQLEGDASPERVLSAPHPAPELIKADLLTHKCARHLALLGMRKGENEYSYPAYTKAGARCCRSLSPGSSLIPMPRSW